MPQINSEEFFNSITAEPLEAAKELQPLEKDPNADEGPVMSTIRAVHEGFNTLDAVMRLDHEVVANWDKWDRGLGFIAGGSANADFNSVQAAVDFGYAETGDIRKYVGLGDVDQVHAMNKLIADREGYEKTYEESGLMGVLSKVLAFGAAPTSLIPVVGVLSKSGRLARAMQGAMQGSALGFASNQANALLLSNAGTHDYEGITASTVIETALFGTFGGVIGKMTAAERSSVTDMFTTIMNATGDEATAVVKGGRPMGVQQQMQAQRETLTFMGVREADMKKFGLALDESAGVSEKVVRGVSGMGFTSMISPIIKGLTSSFIGVRRFTSAIYEHTFDVGKNTAKGGSEKSIPSIEAGIKQDMGDLTRINKEIGDLYVAHVGLEGKTAAHLKAFIKSAKKEVDTPTKFQHDVAAALNKGYATGSKNIDNIYSPQVIEAATIMRTSMTNQVKRMRKAGIDLPEIADEDLMTYLSRQYNYDKILTNWKNSNGLTFRDVIRADFAKGMGALAHSPEVTKAVEKTVSRILGNDPKAMQVDELITGLRTSGGNVTKARVLMIDDLAISEFLNRDATGLFNAYHAQTSAAIRFKEGLTAHGFEDMADLERGIVKEGEDLMEHIRKRKKFKELDSRKGKSTAKEEAVFDKELIQIQKEIKEAINEVRNQAKDIMGQYATRSKFPKLDNALKYLRKFQTIRVLGGMVISAIPDPAMHIFKNGLANTFDHAFKPFFKNMKLAKLSRDELKQLSVGLELESNEILKILTDGEFEVMAGKTTMDKATDWMLDNFGKLTLNTYWTRSGKRVAGHIQVGRTFPSLQKLAKGEKITAKEQQRLLSMGLDEADAQQIMAQFEKAEGYMQDGSWIGNYHRWDTDIRHKFGAAIRKEVDATIITPGRGDIPFIAKGSEIAKTIFQFKSFSAAATNKILLSGLIRQDANVMAGVVSLMMLGGQVWMIKNMLAGKDAFDGLEGDEAISMYLLNGVTRTGLLGLMGDQALSAIPGGANPRYAGLSFSSQVMGPSYTFLGDAYQAFNGAADGEITQSDWKQIRRMLPYQNLFWLRGMFEAVNGK